jgi:hypothetical protein
MSEDVLIKFGSEASCKSAGCSTSPDFKQFIAAMAANFMASDQSMDEAFKSTKLQFAAGQAGVELPKFAVADAGDTPNAQVVGNAAVDTAVGRA